MTHTHPCQHCGTPSDCEGVWERNVDGFPEIVCPEFHRQDGSNPEFVCAPCAREQEDRYIADLRQNL